MRYNSCDKILKNTNQKEKWKMWYNSKCYKCKTPIKLGYEWTYHYFYCPKCREDRSEDGNKTTLNEFEKIK